MSTLATDLRHLVSGSVGDDAPTLAYASTDFGNYTSRVPRVVVEPQSVAEAQAVVRFAAKHQIPVCARGLGHSQGGQALCEQAIILSTRGLVRRELRGLEAVAEAGVLWAALVRDGAALGVTPRVLTMYTGLTVGGTLSVGGVGANSFVYGQQIDQVLALQVITGEGDLVTCTRDSDLVHAVLGGLGHCGFIAEATIALRSAEPQLHGFRFVYDDFTQLLSALDRAANAGAAQFLYALLRPGNRAGILCIGIEGAADEAEQSARTLAHDSRQALPAEHYTLGASHFFAVSQTWPKMPHFACPWTDLFFDWSTAPAMFARLRQVGLEQILAAGDAAIIRLPDGRGLIGCFPMIPRDKVHDLLPAVREVGRVCREEFGGRNYLSGYLPFTTAEEWSHFFGERWPVLQAAKRRYDPRNIFHPGLIL